jgi:hypothetical protein
MVMKKSGESAVVTRGEPDGSAREDNIKIKYSWVYTPEGGRYNGGGNGTMAT